jgi:hypothetical protein
VSCWAAQADWPWAVRRGVRGLGRPGREREDGLGLVGFWAGLEWGLGLVEGFVFYFYYSFLFLLQTKFEFKSKFEFKPHSNKIMHQHECNKRFKPKINFN